MYPTREKKTALICLRRSKMIAAAAAATAPTTTKVPLKENENPGNVYHLLFITG